MASINESKKEFKTIKSVLGTAAEHNLNVLLRGESGVGKTHMVMDIAEEKGLKLKYFSASTLDPFADLVGIPVPKEDHVEYFRLADINEAEFMFFDELNRSHKRVMNAVLEIIQFQTLNGDKLPNLKMVWAAINPWEQEGYQTEVLDLALQGRFHFNIDVPYDLSFDYFSEKFGEDIAKAAFGWWWNLDEKLRIQYQPRRLDYTLDAMVKDIPYGFTAPFDVKLPFQSLKKAVDLSFSSVKLKDLIKNKDKYIKIIQNNNIDHQEYVDIVRILTSIADDEKMVVKLLDIIYELPTDYMAKIIIRNNKYQTIREIIFNTVGDKELVEWDKKIQDKINP